jgi:hypothetical protein
LERVRIGEDRIVPLSPDRKTAYMREYMRRRRAAAKAGKPVSALTEARQEIEQLRKRIKTLEQAGTGANKGLTEKVGASQFSKTAQAKVDAAIRQYQKKLDLEFEGRVSGEIKRRLEESVLPHYNETRGKYEMVINAYKGIMSKLQFRKLLMCLHPDRSASNTVLAEMLIWLRERETLFVKKEDRAPSGGRLFPKTVAELMKMKEEVEAQRRASRAAGRVNKR